MTTPAWPALPAVDELVVDEPERHSFRVHRAALSSQELFELELERVFGHCWLYVGHESELPDPGSFVRRRVGTRPVMFVRGQDGRPRVFFNVCPHRGATICRQDRGRTKSFQCFYHAWTFNTEGEFQGGPDMDGYGGEWDRSAVNLAAPARTASYRGFWFLSFDPEIEPLDEYLGPAREYLDLVVDQSESGIEVLPGSQRYTIHANWKLLMENSIDGYHAAPVHVTYFKYAGQVARKAGGTQAAGPSNRYGFGRSLGGGHAAMDVRQSYGRPVARWSPLFGEEAREPIERRRERLRELHGPTKAYRISDVTTNLLVYPNLIINNGVALTIRKVDPVAPDRLESTAWAAAPADESPEMRERRLDSFLTFYGPGGFATPDDVEALESCQEGYTCMEPGYSDVSRGMDRSPTYLDEGGLRGFWRTWQAQMADSEPRNMEEGTARVDWEAARRDWEGEAP